MTLFPSLNLQQSLNTVAIRQMVPRGPFESELFWTFLGFDEDEDRKTLISLDHGAIGEFVQKAIRGEREQTAIIEIEDGQYLVTTRENHRRARFLSDRHSTRDLTVSGLL